MKTIEEKRCNNCRYYKNKDDFYFEMRSNRKYTRPNCKDCDNLANKKRYCKKSARNTNLKRLYGIDQKGYEEMLSNQLYRCGICEEKLNPGKVFHVDHCHNSGIIRGLLCGSCNLGLGKFKDNILNLRNAINYLEINE